MITERLFPRDELEFTDALTSRLAGARSVAIHAGHFLLHVDERTGEAVPTIVDGTSGVGDLEREVGYFPLLSWMLACRSLQALQDIRLHLLVIVNDWQYVPDPTMRDRFYARMKSLPESFTAAASSMLPEARMLRPAGITGRDAGTPFFSERSLRNRYNRRLADMLRDGSLPADTTVETEEHRPACRLEDVAGRSIEVYCPGKDADCSKEVAKVIEEAHALSACDVFVNFYPAVCQEFVELGSELGDRLFGPSVRRVINVALPATRVFSVGELVRESEFAIHELGESDYGRELRASRA